MKTLKYLAICAAAFTFAACNVAEPEALQKENNLVTVSFGAEAVEPLTKATLTPGETSFKAEWSEGEQISVYYINEAGDEGVATATWDGSYFQAELPDYEGMWFYLACYPKIGEYDFAEIVQEGAAYNSIPDLMFSEGAEVTGKAGKDENGNNIVFQMKRERAILYFHFTSDLDDEIVGATLTSGFGDLTYKNVNVYYDEQYWSLATESIHPVKTINLSTSQPASDFTLWFNVDARTYEDLTLTVTTAGNSTFTLSREGEIYYEPGKAYTVDMEIADAQWGSADGNEDPDGTEYTVTTTVNDIVEENGFEVSSGSAADIIKTIVLDDHLVMSTDGTGNSGSFWGTSTIDWRLYQSTGANLKFAVDKGYYIKSVKVTYNSNSNGKLYYYDEVLASGDVHDGINYSSVTYDVGATSGTSGQVRVTAVEVVYVKGEMDAIVATGIELDPETVSIKVGETATVSATVTPSNATVRTVTWESSNKSVATVSKGTITAIGVGEAEITATVDGTEISASCTVTVTAANVYTLEELVAAGAPTEAGKTVTVVLDEEPITGIFTTGTYRNGVFVQAGGKEIEIYCRNVPTNWIVGGTISGSITCPWKLYSGTWELCPTSWEDIVYTAPAVIPTYDVILPSVANGTLSASVSKAAENQTVTVTATPAAGYALASLTAGVTGEKLEGNVLTFTMPGKAVTISASFASASAQSAAFGPDWNSLFGTTYNGTFNPKADALDLSGTSNGVSIAVKNGDSTNGYIKSGDFRMYKGYTTTFTAPSGKSIKRITASKSGKSITGLSVSAGNLSIASDGSSMSWEGSSDTVTFTASTTTGFSSITVFYE